MIPLDIFKEVWTVDILGRITFDQIEDWALEQGFVWLNTAGGPLESNTDLKYSIFFNYRGNGRLTYSENRTKFSEGIKLCVESGRKVKMFTYHEWRDYIVPAVAREKELRKIKEEIG